MLLLWCVVRESVWRTIILFHQPHQHQAQNLNQLVYTSPQFELVFGNLESHSFQPNLRVLTSKFSKSCLVSIVLEKSLQVLASLQTSDFIFPSHLVFSSVGQPVFISVLFSCCIVCYYSFFSLYMYIHESKYLPTISMYGHNWDHFFFFFFLLTVSVICTPHTHLCATTTALQWNGTWFYLDVSFKPIFLY